jgi:hypothetical protein
VPILSVFFGITIRVFFEDHAPPHVHIEYAEYRAVIEIATGRVLAGRLPRRCATLVEEWRALHLADLRRAWKAASRSQLPKRIAPLT